MHDLRFVTLAAAFAISVAAIGARGGFGGWLAEVEAWRARRSDDPLARTDRLASAVAADPLLPRHRRALDEALTRDLEAIGAKTLAQHAPAAAVPRSRFVAALTGAGAGELAAPLASGVAPRDRLELEALDRESLVIAARGLAREGRCAEGMPLFAAFTARSASSARIDLDVGRCWLQLGAPEKALPYIDRAREREADSRWPRLARAEALLALERLGEADEESAALAADLPDFYYGWYVRGRVLLHAGRASEAMEAFDRALALGVADEGRFWLRYQKAKAVLAAGDAARARTEAAALVDERPDVAAPWALYGRSLFAAGAAKEAIRALERAIRLGGVKDDPFWLRYHLVQARLAANDTERARTEAAVLVELRPDLSAAWALYGRILLAAGRAGEATRALERAVASRGPGEKVIWPRFQLAEAHLAAGAPQKCEALAGELVTEDPRFYYGWHLRGRALEALGRPEEAADAYRRALALRPANRWLEPRIEALDARATRPAS